VLTKASFGSVELFGRKYGKDVIVHVDGSITKRKKKKSKDFKLIYGHTPLSEKELEFLEEEKPKVVYVGTGYDSALPITENAQKILSKFETVVMPTPEIIDKLEHEKRKLVAIIHVTC
jgi:hypothetical protein